MTTFLFFDTNIWLDEYRCRPPTNKGDVSRLASMGDDIITTAQLRNEFLRNLNPALSEGLADLKKGCYPPRVAHLDPNASAAEKALEALRLDHRTDPVWLALDSLCRSRKLHLPENDPRWAGIVSEAESRKKVNKPPAKDKHTTLGDHVNWLWALQCCKASRASLLIVSRDNDYGHPGDSGVPNHALVQEFRDTVGLGYDLKLTHNLNLAMKELGKPKDPTPNPPAPYTGKVPRLLGKRYPDNGPK
jgi:hypothetical protein